MKKLLISSFDLEVGGVERSLLAMLEHFDYERYKVDLMLYRHTGDFFSLLPDEPALLPEIKVYKTFRMPIKEVLFSGHVLLAYSRLLAKFKANKGDGVEPGYKQMQYMWKYALPFLPKLKKKYDVAISYLWPHYFVAEKVDADVKIAWVHTDYSSVETDVSMDLSMWEKFHYIVAVSEGCKDAFLTKYPRLKEKVIVIENLMNPTMIRRLAEKETAEMFKKDNRFKIVTVTRLSYAKGIDRAVQALFRLHEKGYKKVVWYVIGYGGDETEIRRLIKKYKLEDSFILVGKQLNPYAYMKEADLYVQPSRYEGKAVTVREAQILGKPVIVTNYATAMSQVKNGVDGIICRNDVNGIVEGVERLYNNEDLRRQLRNFCAKSNFDNKKELEKLYAIMGMEGVEGLDENIYDYVSQRI